MSKQLISFGFVFQMLIKSFKFQEVEKFRRIKKKQINKSSQKLMEEYQFGRLVNIRMDKINVFFRE